MPPARLAEPEREWVCHFLCDYPVTGYHARRNGRILCVLEPAKPAKRKPREGEVDK